MQKVIDAAFEEIHAMMTALVRETYANLPPETIAAYEKSGVSLAQLISVAVQSVTESVMLVKMILPGILLLLVQLLGYVAVTAFQITARLSYGKELFCGMDWLIFPTKTTCGIYMATASIYALFSIFVSSTALFMVMVLNMLLAVLPSMIACGTSCLRMRLRHPYRKTKTLVLTILIALGSLFLPTYVLPVAILLLGFVGAQDVFILRTLSEQKALMDQGGEDEEDQD